MRYIVNLRSSKNWSGTVETITGTVDAIPHPPMAGLMKFTLTKETEEMGMYAVIGLPGPSAADVVSQELTVQVGDQTPFTADYAGDVAVSEEFACGEAGTVVTATLIDVDGSGNRSEPREELFTVVDTIAPPIPGEFTMSVTRQD